MGKLILRRKLTVPPAPKPKRRVGCTTAFCKIPVGGYFHILTADGPESYVKGGEGYALLNGNRSLRRVWFEPDTRVRIGLVPEVEPA